jgi:hypothetical protein
MLLGLDVSDDESPLDQSLFAIKISAKPDFKNESTRRHLLPLTLDRILRVHLQRQKLEFMINILS